MGASCTSLGAMNEQATTEQPVAGSAAPGVAETDDPASSMPQRPTTTAVAGSGASPQTNTAATSGTGGPAAAPADAPPKPACSAGELRCNPTTPGTLDTCSAGQWAAQPCAAGEMCIDLADGSKCVTPVEACAGQEGQNVCTDTGEMLACMPGGEAMTIATCTDSALCKAGITAGECALCVPGSFQCMGEELQACDAQGQQYALAEMCGSAALCSAEEGRCTPAACEAEQFMCEGDVLKRCSADLTELTQVRQCDPGLCDEQGGACRMCMPGVARCSGSNRQECNATGQAFAAAACPMDTPFCAGEGECTQCRLSADCPARACRISTCALGSCADVPEIKGARACSQLDGTTIRPSNDPMGRIYVIGGGAAFHIVYGEDLEQHFGGINNVNEVSSLCGTRPAAGSNLQEVGNPKIVHIGLDGLWHHIVRLEDLEGNCGGLRSVAKIPAGGLAANGIREGDPI